MPKTALEQWDETAANNTDVGSNNINEGNAPSTMNNAIRETMSQVAKWLGDDPLASATTTDLGSVPGRYVSITGTTTITGLGTIKAGTIKYVKFAGILTLTQNATSLILPGAASIVTAAGDTAIMVSEGSGNWRCVAYQRAGAVPALIGSYTGALSGGASAPTATINFCRVANLVTLQLTTLTVTSDSTGCAISGMPAAIRPTSPQLVPCVVIDNGVRQFGQADIESSGTITLYTGAAIGGFTALGTKGIGRCAISYLV